MNINKKQQRHYHICSQPQCMDLEVLNSTLSRPLSFQKVCWKASIPTSSKSRKQKLGLKNEKDEDEILSPNLGDKS